MTLSDINAILKEVWYPGIKIYAIAVGGRMALQGKIEDPVHGDQYTRKWYISQHACKNEVVNTAFKLVLTAVEHEVREQFSYRDKHIFGPHYDVDFLAEACGKRKNLDYREKT